METFVSITFKLSGNLYSLQQGEKRFNFNKNHFLRTLFFKEYVKFHIHADIEF